MSGLETNCPQQPMDSPSSLKRGSDEIPGFACIKQTYSSDLLSKLKEQVNLGSCCDVNVVVENRTFWAHRCVLAANSPMFSSSLENLQGTSRVVLHDIPADAFEPILSFLYTGRLDLNHASVQKIEAAAVSLQLNNVQELCKYFTAIDLPRKRRRITKKEALVPVEVPLQKELVPVEVPLQKELVPVEVPLQKELVPVDVPLPKELVPVEVPQKPISESNVDFGRCKKEDSSDAYEQHKLPSSEIEMSSANSQPDSSNAVPPVQCQSENSTNTLKNPVANEASGKVNSVDTLDNKDVSGSGDKDEVKGKGHKAKSDEPKLEHCFAGKGKTKVANSSFTKKSVQNVNAFICIKCELKFKSKSSLRRHNILCHWSVNLRRTGKFPVSVICRHCPKQFLHRRLLQNHKPCKHQGESVKRASVKNVKKVEIMSHKLGSFGEWTSNQGIVQNERKSARLREKALRKNIVKQEIEDDYVRELSPKKKLTASLKEQKEKLPSCIFCKKVFKSKKNMKYHVHYRFRCSKTTCRKTYATHHSLMLHVAHHKQETQKVTCSHCEKEFGSIILLQRHVARIHDQKKYEENCIKCDKCSKFFSLRSILLSHICEDAEPCGKCDQLFHRYGHNKRHLQTHMVRYYYPCKVCAEPFYRKVEVENHQKIHDPLYKFACHVCGQRYCESEQLEEHLKDHRTFTCGICQKEVLLFNLASHISEHQESLETSLEGVIDNYGKYIKVCKEENSKKCVFNCTICRRQRKTVTAIKKHVELKHFSDPVRYKCEECGKSLSSLYCLRAHMDYAHRERKPFLCDLCGFRTANKYTMKKHKLVKHSDKKQYTCDICNKSYKRNDALKQHKQIAHSDAPKYCCEICGGSYKSVSVFYKHKRRHSKYTYPCRDCGESFWFQKQLITHIKNKHMRQPYRSETINTVKFKKYNLNEIKTSVAQIQDDHAGNQSNLKGTNSVDGTSVCIVQGDTGATNLVTDTEVQNILANSVVHTVAIPSEEIQELFKA